MKLRIFFSGEASYANPEIILKEKASVMLTFADLQNNGKAKRWSSIRKARKKNKRVAY